MEKLLINRESTGPGENSDDAYQTAPQYIGSKDVAPGAQEEKLVMMAEAEISEALQKINMFYAASGKITGNRWKERK